jgi:PKD repeat protein
MMRWKSRPALTTVVASVIALALVMLAIQEGASGQATVAAVHPATGVGSCTLRNWAPSLDPRNSKDLPEGHRPQLYAPDDFDCTGAVFARPGVEFRRFPQPHDFRLIRHGRVYNDQTQISQPAAQVAHARAAVNPLAPYFPPFTHFVLIYRENHTFDDYLGDCAKIYTGCNGQVESTNHISSVPDLHTLASTYALSDAYSTGTQPPSGPNHWFMFSGQSASSSQQQSYPTAGGTSFDRFLKGTTGPAGEGTNACTAQTGSGTGSSPYTFVMNGDFYWMLNSGSGFWRNPGTGNPEVLPVNRPGTSIPEELHYNEYACQGQSVSDTTVMNDYESFVTANGLPAYSYVELFNDHPGTYQDIPTNDADTANIVNFLMGNSAYKNNTVIIVTEDDTQNGNNGPDHVSDTYRVPLVVIGSPTYVKAHYLSHVAYTTSNVIAAMERTLENVHAGIIDPNDNLGLSTFPMTTADQAALGDPLEDFWVQGATPLSANATGTPTTGNAPLAVSLTGSATGGTAPYSYSWNFGDGSPTSTAQNPSHTYTTAGTYTATLTVTDSASPAHTATSTVKITVNSVGGTLSASASGNPTSGQIPLTTNFTAAATGGTPPYSYKWDFGDGSATSTTQNPSHTYGTVGTYTATLTVTDGASPAHTATATVAVTADPIAGTPPGPPTGLTATAGTNQITLKWVAPTSTGGQAITAYTVYRGTSSGNETKLTSGGCGGLGNVLTCTDTGLSAGTTYYYKVTASNPSGEGAQSNEASASPTASSCTSAQLIGNPGFETGAASPWTATSGVINGPNSTDEPPHSGAWDAWLDGYGRTHTDTLAQTVKIPMNCVKASLTFWLHVDTTDPSTTTAYHTLKVQLLNGSGTVLSTLHTYSNLDAASGYHKRTFDLTTFIGQTVALKFTGYENSRYNTSFVLDDLALNVS